MLLHVDNVKFKVKPTQREIGGIKKRFTKAASIRDMTIKQVADALTAGKTIQPGVCPFSDKSRREGKAGTCKEDFKQQILHLNDIDNKRTDIPFETPEHVVEVLAAHKLKATFMYETFNSTAGHQRFRFALMSDEAFTDKDERDRVQAALIALFPQSDPSCTNADRMFFGTDKGLLDDYTDFDAVCKKADLLALADEMEIPEHPEEESKAAAPAQAPTKSKWTKFGEPIPTGERHGTLVSFAASVLKRFGITDQAHDAYIKRVAQCEEPKPDDEIEKIWRDACAYYERIIATAPDYMAPGEYAAQEFAQSLEPTDYTDVGQAKVFINQYGSIVRYSDATKWLVYDGKRWVESDVRAQKLAQELTDRQLQEARRRLKIARAHMDAAVEADDEDKAAEAKDEELAAKSFRAFVLDRRKTTRIAATLTEARTFVEIDVSELDKDGFKLNTPAGTVDLRTGKMYPHNPLDLITKMTAVSPSLEGMDKWLRFMNDATSQDKDKEEYLQIVSGMEAVGAVYQEKIELAHGQGGNGKSTFYNSKARSMGDYAGSLSAETLTVNCRKNKSPEYAELRGKRLVIAAELEEGMRLDTAVVKKLCSTDPIEAEKKYKAPFHFLPSHTTVLYTNHLPKVGTIDRGTWDRLIVIPFNARFRGMKGEVMNYTEYLFEHCGGAILTWIIEGARKFIAANYHINPPECVKQAIAEYRYDNDWLSAFIESRCTTSPGLEQRAGDLYDAYRTYCIETHEWARGTGDFKAALVGAGYAWKKTSAGACYYGLSLKPEFEPIIPL